nr:MAG TPA: hypothetical protein [Caudoviricetes sp.]
MLLFLSLGAPPNKYLMGYSANTGYPLGNS